MFNNDNRIFDGAGVLPINLYDNNTYVYLFFDTDRQKWSEPGGTRDEGESLIDTAIREAYEESCMVLKYSSKRIETAPFIDRYRPNDDKWYRCYIMRLYNAEPDIFRQKYHRNRNELITLNKQRDSGDQYKHYLETNDTARFLLNEQLLDHPDIFSRTKDILKRCLDMMRNGDLDLNEDQKTGHIF